MVGVLLGLEVNGDNDGDLDGLEEGFDVIGDLLG